MSGVDGGNAFPVVETTVHMAGDGDSGYVPVSDVHSVGGMTLRDYFAAKAMAAMIGTSASPTCIGGLEGGEPYCAMAAYRMADAMLAARATGGQP